MSTRTILVWQLCCEAGNHTSDAPKKDTRVREIWRTELKRRPHPSLRCLQHLHELTLNICDCRCLDDSNVERKACSGFRSRRQQSLLSGLSPSNVERLLLESADSRGLPQTSRNTQDLVRPAWSLVDSSVLREWIKAAVLIPAQTPAQS